MKYHAPVRELLAQCVRGLDPPFTSEPVIAWFARHYPEISPNTVRTQMHNATEPRGGTGPLLVRAGRGAYRLAEPSDGSGNRGGSSEEAPAADTRSPRAEDTRADIVLVGCVKTKEATARPARDLYTSPLFQRRRAYAERTGRPWYVVSARWGLVAPHEEVAPYDLHLATLPASFRRAWAGFVTAQLAQHGPLAGTCVEIHAGADYTDALRPALEEHGAVVRAPVRAGSLGQILAWYDRRAEAAGPAAPTPPPPPPPASVPGARPAPAGVRQTAAALSDPSAALPAARLRGADRAALSAPGLYTWWVDASGARDLSSGLAARVGEGMIYAGQAGATRWPSGRRSRNTLYERLVGMHLDGSAGFSTFRLSLAAVLAAPLGIRPGAEHALTAWMEEHLRVVPVPVTDADALGALEREVLALLDPPLNLQHMPDTTVRSQLTRLRAAWKA